MKRARKQIHYEMIEPSVSVFADQAAFSFSLEYSVLDWSHGQCRRFFHLDRSHGMVARKLVNM
jgi:hypothetical protein